MPALFVVRAVVADPADRAAFGAWYEQEHLPDAIRAFGASAAWRAWGHFDPSVHWAFYRFADVAAAEAATGPDKLRPLIAEFDRRWGTRVTRSRDILDVVDEQQPHAAAQAI